MHLLNIDDDGSFKLTRFTENNVPAYAILSHTWEADDKEVKYNDLINGMGISHKAGYRKIQLCGEKAQRDGLQYFWVDSCCIDKSSSADLSEAINSMFRWYQKAARCYVYLSDVSAGEQFPLSQNLWRPSFRQSRWFTRGWTLQELLAPSSVEFYSQEGKLLGDKVSLEREIAEITGIASRALQGYPLPEFTVEERMSWVHRRRTTIVEDKAYSLFGVFDVHMPLIYGEGQEKALRRLHEEINKPLNRTKMDLLRLEEETDEVIKWTSPSDVVGTFHNDTCRLREPCTGEWFLKGQRFENWKHASDSVIWLHGSAGCGKTVLCSSIITDLTDHCNMTPDCRLAYFYFSFSNLQLQPTQSLLRTLIRQLLTQRKTVPDGVRDIYKRFKHSSPPLEVWMNILRVLIDLEGHTYLIIDALDECPSQGGERSLLLQSLQRLIPSPNQKLHLLITSRKEPTIEAALLKIVTIRPVGIQNSDVDDDIRLHVQAQLMNHPVMNTWPTPVQKEVEDALTTKADGMFRWVVCQLDALHTCRRTSAVRQVLRSLPRTLDETYERSLLSIKQEHRREAISALTWLVFSKYQFTVAALAEGSVIDITSATKPPFDTNDRLFNPNSIVDILSGLVSVDEWTPSMAMIRLAHFSVEEYLVSDRILVGPASMFHLSYLPSVQNLLSGCLQYLLAPDLRSPCNQRHETFPFLRYAVDGWLDYAKDCRGSTPEWLIDIILGFFDCKDAFRMWQDQYFVGSESADLSDRGCSSLWENYRKSRANVGLGPFYYACRLGIVDVVRKFLQNNLAAKGLTRTRPRMPGLYADELRVACHFGHENVVVMLLNAGADHSAVGGRFKTALSAAMHTKSPNEQIVGQLLEVGGHLQVSDFLTGWIMRWAVGHGHLHIVNLLLKNIDSFDTAFAWTIEKAIYPPPADLFWGVNIQQFGPRQQEFDRSLRSSPYLAALLGQFDVLKRLLEYWDNVEEADDDGRTALYWAIFNEYEDIVRILLEKGARLDAIVRIRGWRFIDRAIERGTLTMRALLEETTAELRLYR